METGLKHRLPKWIKDRTISFVPPDGRFTLLQYRLGPPSSLSVPGGLKKRGGTIAIPLALKVKVTVGQAGGRLLSFLPLPRLPVRVDTDPFRWLVGFRLVQPYPHGSTCHSRNRVHIPHFPPRRRRHRRKRYRHRRPTSQRRRRD
jgi:hypothetical protein